MGGRWCSHLVEVELLDTFLMMIQSDSTTSATKFKQGVKSANANSLQSVEPNQISRKTLLYAECNMVPASWRG
jgi:hypothetical protein